MKRHLATKALILSLALLGGCPAASGARGAADTLRVSEHFTTHLIFPTDIIYADLSNSSVVAAKILEQSRNMMALKARNPFEAPLSVSALESNGAMHTYIVLYEEPLDQDVLSEAVHYIRHADILIVGGTSLNVYPAAGLINYYRGSKLVLVNRSATPYDRYADLVIHANIGDVFSQV